MKSLNLIVFGMVLGLSTAQSARAEGHEAGSGGDGITAAWSILGGRLHRMHVVAPEGSRMQGDYEIDPGQYKIAVDTIKAVEAMLDRGRGEQLLDNQGHPVTARYDVYKDPKNGEEKIRFLVDVDRFERELDANPALALTVMNHEYYKAMKLNDSNYQAARETYSLDFFQEWVKTDAVIQSYIQAVREKIKRQDVKSGANQKAKDSRRKARYGEALELLTTERRAALDQIKQNQGAIVSLRGDMAATDELIRTQLTSMGNVWQKELSRMSMIPMPFPSVRGKSAGGMLRMAAAGVGMRSKMSGAAYEGEMMDFLLNDTRGLMSSVLQYNDVRRDVVTQRVLELIEKE